MKLLALTMLLTSALAAPHPKDMASNPCGGGGLYTNALCCSFDTLELGDVDCNSRTLYLSHARRPIEERP